MKLQPSPVKQLALQHHLPVWTPVTAKDPAFQGEIAKLGADAAVVVAYGQILNDSFLALFPDRVLNVHASLLPRWRGAAPIQRAIMAGDTQSGVSVQIMVKALDAGDVIAEVKCPISPDMTAPELHDVLMGLGAKALANILEAYLAGELSRTPQKAENVTYAKKIEKSEGAVDWSVPAKNLYNQFRGLLLGPGIKTQVNGFGVKLTKIRPVESPAPEQAKPGEIWQITSEAIRVCCGQGLIDIYEIQPESRANMTVAEFKRGYELKEGMLFG